MLRQNQDLTLVVAGCGAAGAEVVKRLKNNFNVIVVSPDSKLVCQALLPMFLAGRIGEESVFIDLKPYFKRNNVKYIQRDAKFVKFECKTLFTSKRGAKPKVLRGLKYDFLVIAIGGVSCTYGVEGVDKALFLNTFEEAKRAKKKLEKSKSVAVVGSGVTGVEVAYELAIAGYDVKVLEAANRILPAMSTNISYTVERELKKVGVKVEKSCFVEKLEEGFLVCKNSKGERKIKECEEVIWCAGIKGRKFSGLKYAKFGILVDERLKVKDSVFAIGDCAQVGEGDKMATKTALEAKRQASFVSKLILKGKGNHYKPFSSVSKPFSIIVFGNKGIVVYGNRVIFNSLLNKPIHKFKMWITNRFLSRFD